MPHSDFRPSLHKLKSPCIESSQVKAYVLVKPRVTCLPTRRLWLFLSKP